MKISDSNKDKIISEQCKNSISNKVKELWKDPKYRNKMITSAKKHWSKPESRKKSSEKAIERMKDGKIKNKIRNTLVQYHKDNPGLLAGENNNMYGKTYVCSEKKKNKIAVALIEKYRSTEERIKMSCWHQNVKREEWKGFATDQPYCQEWTKDLKNYVKERDNYICQNEDC